MKIYSEDRNRVGSEKDDAANKRPGIATGEGNRHI